MRVCVIGGGWYGCHSSKCLLEQGIDVLLVEAAPELFAEASMFNQCRLHLGYHYARSFDTRAECSRGYARFVQEYFDLTHGIKNNLYCVAADSSVDLRTYEAIMESSSLRIARRDPAAFPLTNVQGVLQCDERVLIPRAARSMFDKLLAGKTRLSATVSGLVQEGRAAIVVLTTGERLGPFAFAVDCTYGHLAGSVQAASVFLEPCLSLVYRPLTPAALSTAYTVVDGPFISLVPFPWGDATECTLTSVAHTPLMQCATREEALAGAKLSSEALATKRTLFEDAVSKYLPRFKEHYEYVRHFTSIKTKRPRADADRSYVSMRWCDVPAISVWGGKVTGIFDAATEVMTFLLAKRGPSAGVSTPCAMHLPILSAEGRSALIGCTGFVGSSLARQVAFTDHFNSTTIRRIQHRQYDLIVCAGLPAAKWVANSEPAADLANMECLLSHLRTVRCNKFVCISTVDVLDDPAAGSVEGEGEVCPAERLHPYGRHRRLFERCVQELFPGRVLVLRLPALFGQGLKKNVVFDLLHNNQVQNIDTRSSFQWYPLRRLATDLALALDSGIGVLHLAVEPVSTSDIVKTCFKSTYAVMQNRVIPLGRSARPQLEPTGATVMYDMRTKHSYLGRSDGSSSYILSRQQVLEELTDFVRTEQCRRLAVSSIAWAEMDSGKLPWEVLASQGVTNVELAPCTVWPGWHGLSQATALEFRKLLERRGCRIVSLQGVMFGTSGLELFGSPAAREGMFTHLSFCCQVAHWLGARVVVFGAPRARKRREMPLNDAFDAAVNFFRRLGPVACSYDVVITIEPNAEAYGCDFMTDIDQAMKLVRAVGHEAVRLHLDTGNMQMSGDSVEAAAVVLPWVAHVHASLPMMAAFSELSEQERGFHERFSEMLTVGGYGGSVCLEMHPASCQVLAKSLRKFVDIYKKLGDDHMTYVA